MSMKGLMGEIVDFSKQLEDSRLLGPRIHGHWYRQPDSITYQASSPRHMEILVEDLSPGAEEITCIEQDGPFEIAVKRAGSLMIPRVAVVNWIKLVETSEEQRDKVWEGVSSLNFMVDDVKIFKRRLDRVTNLPYEKGPGGISIKFNRRGQRVNFVNKSLAAITAERLDSNLAIPVEFTRRDTKVKSRSK